jgi:hypothetical protein
MKEILLLGVVIALALVIVGVSVFAGHDTSLFVSPPEAVCEDFARKVVTGRYDRAIKHVDPSAGISLATIRSRAESLRARAGPIDQVEGEAATMADDAASAGALLTTEQAGSIRWTFSLVRRSGEWRIVGWQE